MFVVALNGSPRKAGNTQLLLDASLEGAQKQGAEVIRVDLNELKYRGCQACDSCRLLGRCVLRDDLDQVFDLLDKADVLIIGTPIYFSGPTSQLKAAMDRCQSIWVRGPARIGRKAGLIAVAADPGANFRNTISEVRSFFNSVGFTSTVEMTIPGLESKGQVASMPQVLEDARALGRELASN
jgi:multimeric flavodoxin WrbA